MVMNLYSVFIICVLYLTIDYSQYQGVRTQRLNRTTSQQNQLINIKLFTPDNLNVRQYDWRQ